MTITVNDLSKRLDLLYTSQVAVYSVGMTMVTMIPRWITVIMVSLGYPTQQAECIHNQEVCITYGATQSGKECDIGIIFKCFSINGRKCCIHVETHPLFPHGMFGPRGMLSATLGTFS